MSTCPLCGFENIEGADNCEQCEQSLGDLSLPAPGSEVERRLLTDRIEALNPRTPLTVTPETPVGEVLDLLVENAVGSVVVVQDGVPVGIFSERDALIKLNVDVATLAARPVSDFMVSDPQTLLADAKVAFAVHRMDVGAYRHLPIVDRDGRMTGIISARDILQYIRGI